MRKKRLVVAFVVEAVWDFVYGRLANSAAAEACKHIAAELQRLAEDPEVDLVMIFQRDRHEATEEAFLQSDEGKYFPIFHCPEGDEGMEIVPELQPFAMNAWVVVDKPYIFDPVTVGAIKNVEEQLKTHIDEIRFYGFLTGMCVLGAAVQTRANFQSKDTLVVVDAKGTADVTPEEHEAALNAMARNFITIVNRE